MSRVVVVTGGAKGIGKAVAERFAGDRVEAGGRDMLDVTDEDAVAAFFERVGPVDVLVNNAGVAEGAPLAHDAGVLAPPPRGERHRRVPLHPRRPPGMVERGTGRIVTDRVDAGLHGARYTAAYAAPSTLRSG